MEYLNDTVAGMPEDRLAQKRPQGGVSDLGAPRCAQFAAFRLAQVQRRDHVHTYTSVKIPESFYYRVTPGI